MNEQADNILQILGKATPADIQEGLAWYGDVRAWSENLHQYSHFSVSQIAGVVAVLSPNTPWIKNLEYARNAVLGFRFVKHNPVKELSLMGVRTFYSAVEKAYLILRDNDFEQIGGRKVWSFWHNIAFEDSPEITHDVWSRRVVANDLLLPGKGVTEKQYRDATQAYHIAFQQTDIEGLDYPYQLQAITWTTARRLASEL